MTTIRQVPMKRRLNPVEAAEYLGIKPGTLKKWRHDRRLPYYQLGWRTIVYDVQDLDRYLECNRVEALNCYYQK